MKNLKLTIFFLFLLFFNQLSAQCTGSAFCSTCKNCSRCKHCKGGRVCGVCSPESFKAKKTNSPKPTLVQPKSEKETTTINSELVNKRNDSIPIIKIAKQKVEGKQIYSIVEVNAEYSGGISEMGKFITTNLKCPNVVTEKGISGKCFLKFVVNIDGSIDNIEILKGVAGCEECDNEAIRVVKLMPNWTPAKISGKPINSYYNLTVSFRLN